MADALEEYTLGSNVPAKLAKPAIRSRLRRLGGLRRLEPGLHLNDVSEFQGGINWGAYNRGAVVVRASSGYGPDRAWGVNRDGARRSCRVRGWYQYVAPGRDITWQANAFCDLVGQLLPGEFVVPDVEDPGFGGDLRAATLSWFATVRARLHTSPNQEVFYSYWPFVQEHFGGGLSWLGGRPAWIAGYSAGAPWWRPQALLWQHTDGVYGDTTCEPAPGIGRCDCSVYAGTLDQLAAFVGGSVAPTITPGSGGQEDRSKVAICTAPTGRRTDAVVVGADGNVYHKAADSPSALESSQGWENLGSPLGAKSASCAWTSDGAEFVAMVHGADDGPWLKFYDAKLGWQPQWHRLDGALAP